VSESNKELVRRYYERVVDEHRLDELALFIHPNYVDHNSEADERGPSLVAAHLEGLRGTFPDFRLRIEEMIAEGHLVVTRVTARGTHTGVWQGIEPTRSEIQLHGINIDRVEAGLIAEHWGEADTVGMLFQMGVDPFAGERQ
jgi:predicted ester cyclase